MQNLIFVAYAGIVAAMSLRPGTDTSIDPLDKIVHLLVYYIFAVFGYRALRNKRYYPYLCLGIIVYGGLLELGQSYIPGRDMSAYDLLANTVGVLLGAAVVTRKR